MRVGKSELRHETVEAGLRVLARIIAREAVNDRRASMKSAKVDLFSWDGLSAQITEGGTDEKVTRKRLGR